MVSKSYILETPLFFSHGIEIENHLVAAQTGEVLVGNDLLSTWEDMFSNAFEYLKKIKKDKKTPRAITKKIVKIEAKEVIKREKRLSFIFVHYKLGKKTIKVNVFGPDPNISQITWLLELVTPPCEYLEELSFWVDTLYAAALHGLSKSKTKSALLPIGLNPMETRVRSGLTCGEHHHIGVPSFLRAPIYNLLRNFIPHLIALSTSSPFLNKQPSSKINLREKNGKQQVISRGVHSYRLMHNTGQMGPNLPQYLPIIEDTTTREEFANQVKKTPPDDRMIDMFPYTDYSTIELRFFDAQPWTENRLAIVLLIQAIAQKAKELIKLKIAIPTASSKSLYENRRKAIQYGLLAQFSRDEKLTGDFSWFYNYDIENTKPASKLIHSVLGMLIYLEDELLIFDSTYIDYLLLPVLGTKKYTPPFTVCDYLFALYTEQNNNIEKFLKKLYYNDKGKYPPQVAGDFSSFLVSDPPESFSKDDQKKVGLTKLLQKDLTSKQEMPTKKKAKPKRKAKVKPKAKPIEVKKEIIPKKTHAKKIPKETIVKKVDIPKVEPKKVKKKEKKVKAKITAPVVEKPKKKERKKPLVKQVISAFDENEDLEIYSPTIEVEPKYQKINSKIANVMRTRRKEIELKRAEFFKEHLKTEEADFKPFPKKASASFPALISGSELFGYIEISFSNIKKVMYKFRNNPIILKVYDNKTNIEIATLRTFVDISSLEKRQMVQIPISIDIGELYGKITLRVECVTGTNERLLKKGFSFSFIRKDEIAITPKEFFITG
ncbi:MAG: glutamate-cysteine ligase family protein, partial [Candidatus Hodarchaeales archaeon]